MYIFGGFVNGDRANSVYKYHFQASEWTKCDVKGSLPAARAGHSAVVVNGQMYIFGGKDNNDKMLNDLWRLDLNTEAWEQVQVKQDECELPRGR